MQSEAAAGRDAAQAAGEGLIAEEDKRTLHSMGYAQELLRSMRTFQNFAISFSIICILSGGINSFSQGLSSVGGASIGFGWPLGFACSMLFALAMGQIGSAYPTAGGLYHWASILGGRGLGWVTAWFNLVGLITVLAAINVGTYLYLVGSLAPYLGIDTGPLTPTAPTPYSVAVQTVVVGLITISQAVFNHFGIRLTSRLTDLSGYLIFLGAIAITVCMLAFAPHLDFARLVTFRNYSGDAGGGTWPKSGSLTYLLFLSVLLPAYTITGFDASAHTAEETIDARRGIPKGMINAVLWSGIFGFAMLAAVIVAIPDMDKAAAQGSGSFFWIMQQVVPEPFRLILYVIIAFSQYFCGLATVTSASRMIFAFSRDGGLPASHALRRISRTHRTPVNAIWVASVLSILFTIYAPVYTTIAAVCVIFLYISYVLPIAAGLVAFRRSWTAMGPFNLGAAFPVIAVLCVLACAMLVYIGVQPPNDQALTVTIGVLVLSVIIWLVFERRRFQGPPVGDMVRQRQAEIAAEERLVGEA